MCACEVCVCVRAVSMCVCVHACASVCKSWFRSKGGKAVHNEQPNSTHHSRNSFSLIQGRYRQDRTDTTDKPFNLQVLNCTATIIGNENVALMFL